MSDNEDQARSENIFYMKKLHSRACKALGLYEDSNSWFDIVDKLEDQQRELKNLKKAYRYLQGV
jgi:hypothetical protein